MVLNLAPVAVARGGKVIVALVRNAVDNTGDRIMHSKLKSQTMNNTWFVGKQRADE